MVSEAEDIRFEGPLVAGWRRSLFDVCLIVGAESMSVVYTIADIAIIDAAICCGAASSSQIDPQQISELDQRLGILPQP